MPQPYAAYKMASVDWLNVLPEHWSIQPLRNVSEFTTGWTPPTGDSNSYDGQHLWANISDLSYKNIDTTSRRLSTRAIRANRIPVSPVGSLLFSFKLTIGSVSIVKEAMYTNEAIATFRPTVHLLIGYAFYALPYCVLKYATKNIYGAPMLNARLIRSARVVVPPIAEQQQIADYLDTQTAKIDLLIEKQEQLIETLAERRKAVISHAVTKGLDPHAPTKDSGQEWLGLIPATWGVSKLKRAWNVIDCKHLTAEFAVDGIPLASIRELRSKWVDLSHANRTTENFYQQLIEGHRKPRAGDLIFSRNATIGRVAQVPLEPGRFAMGQDVCLIRPIRSTTSSDYQQYLLQSWVVASQIEALLLGSTFKRINVEQIRGFTLPVPDSETQRVIVEYLDSTTAQMDALAAKAREMIDVLRERRQALISAAVTGKIDVRGLS